MRHSIFKVATPSVGFPRLAYGPQNTIASVQDYDIPGRDTIFLMKVYELGCIAVWTMGER
jgi:hypothetical protein